MLKIDARLYVKTNIRQYYASAINEGRLIQEIALYPLSDEYLQQIERLEEKGIKVMKAIKNETKKV